MRFSFSAATASRIEGGPFSTCGSPMNAAQLRLNRCRSLTDSRVQRNRNCLLQRFTIVLAQQLHILAALKGQERCFGTVQDRQDARVRLISGIQVPSAFQDLYIVVSQRGISFSQHELVSGPMKEGTPGEDVRMSTSLMQI
eukprot:592882-Pyramimonas_sp.AAC.1